MHKTYTVILSGIAISMFAGTVASAQNLTGDQVHTNTVLHTHTLYFSGQTVKPEFEITVPDTASPTPITLDRECGFTYSLNGSWCTGDLGGITIGFKPALEPTYHRIDTNYGNTRLSLTLGKDNTYSGEGDIYASDVTLAFHCTGGICVGTFASDYPEYFTLGPSWIVFTLNNEQ